MTGKTDLIKPFTVVASKEKAKRALGYWRRTAACMDGKYMLTRISALSDCLK